MVMLFAKYGFAFQLLLSKLLCALLDFAHGVGVVFQTSATGRPDAMNGIYMSADIFRRVFKTRHALECSGEVILAALE